MIKKTSLILALSTATSLALAAAYSPRGETGGMDPQQPESGQKVDPKKLKKPAGTDEVKKAAPGRPEGRKGKAAIDETAGMDPQQPNAGQKVETRK